MKDVMIRQVLNRVDFYNIVFIYVVRFHIFYVIENTK